MKIVREKISLKELSEMAKSSFGQLVKAVVDIEKNIMAVDSELHSDEEGKLLELGSLQENLWGINIYPFREGNDRIEFDSMINIRPYMGNFSRSVDDTAIREKIIEAVEKLIQ